MLNFIKKYTKVDTVILLATWIVAVMMLGLVDFVNFTFDPSRFLTPKYFVDVSTMLFAGAMIFAVSLYKKYKTFKEEMTDIQAIDNEITETFKDEDTADLSLFIDEVNVERRVISYTTEKETEFENLISKMATKYPDSLAIWAKGTDEEKEKDKYCKELLMLKVQLSDEYIENNKRNLPASFTRITPNFIASGVNKKSANPGIEDPSSYIRQAIGDNYLNFLLPSMIVAVILSFLITRSEESNWVVAFVLALKVSILIFQKYSAEIYAGHFIKATWVSDVHFRHRLTQKYMNWKKEAKSDAKRRPIHQQHDTTYERAPGPAH